MEYLTFDGFVMIGMSSDFFRYKGGKGGGKKGGGGSVKAPPPVAPTPTPKQLDEDILRKDADRRRQMINSAGRGGTILTQGQPLTKGSGGATILGRSTS